MLRAKNAGPLYPWMLSLFVEKYKVCLYSSVDYTSDSPELVAASAWQST